MNEPLKLTNLGFKPLLLLFIVILVVTSVSVSSYIAYAKEENTLLDLITTSNERYVKEQARKITAQLNEKVEGLNKLGQHFNEQPISGSAEELSRNMTAINDIVGELDDNGQQALEQANSISEVNAHLVNIVGRFRLS